MNNMGLLIQSMGLDQLSALTKEVKFYCYDCSCDLDGEEEKERGICNRCYKEYDEERPEDVYGVDGLR